MGLVGTPMCKPKPDEIFVGMVPTNGADKNAQADKGQAKIGLATVADAFFWKLKGGRSATSIPVANPEY